MSGWQVGDMFRHFGSLSLQKRVVYDTHCSVTLPHIITETLKWLLLLPILTQNHPGSDSVVRDISPSPHLLGFQSLETTRHSVSLKKVT